MLQFDEELLKLRVTSQHWLLVFHDETFLHFFGAHNLYIETEVLKKKPMHKCTNPQLITSKRPEIWGHIF